MDTVRADHLSLCGYPRPTSPTLDSLALGGARFTCGGVAPGSWTLPSHASYFTGLPPWEHHADFASGGTAQGVPGISALPLDASMPVLAEQLAAEGRATVLVAANPVLGPASGLTRGFDVVTVSPTLGGMPGSAVVQAVDDALDREDVRAAKGLFLVVNLLDAHNPHPAIPPGVNWVPAQPGLSHNPLSNPEDPLRRFLQGLMSPEEQRTELQRLGDLYDRGIHLEDAAVGELLDLLRARGWAAPGLRLVVTSDHGEMLGEHGELEHGPFLREGTQRVPLLVLGGAGDIPTGIPSIGPLSALVVHDLVLTGRLPAVLPEPVAVAVPDALWKDKSGGRFGTTTQVARWTGDEKTHLTDGVAVRFDLAADPGEDAPVPVSPALFEQLRAAGYVQ